VSKEEHLLQKKVRNKVRFSDNGIYTSKKKREEDEHNTLGLETTLPDLTICSSKETSLLARTFGAHGAQVKLSCATNVIIMRGSRRAAIEDEANGAMPDAAQALMEMMETMRKQNEERAKEFRRAQEDIRRESAEARERMEESARLQERLQRRNKELQLGMLSRRRKWILIFSHSWKKYWRSQFHRDMFFRRWGR